MKRAWLRSRGPSAVCFTRGLKHTVRVERDESIQVLGGLASVQKGGSIIFGR